MLQLSSRRKSEQVYVYTAKASVCNACPVKGECTDSKSGRHIFRSFFQEDLDRVKGCQETEAYQKAIRERALWTGPLFGEANQFHRLSGFRLMGLEKVNIEGVMTAAGQNIKRLIKRKSTELFCINGSICCHIPPRHLLFQQADVMCDRLAKFGSPRNNTTGIVLAF